MKPAQQIQQQGGRWIGTHAKGDVSYLPLPVQRHVALQAPAVKNQFTRPLDDKTACISAGNFRRGAIKELQTQLFFGGKNASAEGRLTQVALLGSAPEMALVCQGHDVIEPAQIHR
jgi:hypothetical protein